MLTLDLTAALKETEGDVELLREVVEAFLEEYPVLLGEIAEALPSRYGPTVQRASHTISGALRLFGDTPVRRAARQLEDIGRTENWELAEVTFRNLQSLLEEFRQQLVETLKRIA
jgi:two-component system, sensor histidine kinase and response regulator